MLQDRGESQWSNEVVVDGMLHDGVDVLALQRAHMRNQTMARQAAEQRARRPLGWSSLDAVAQVAEERERAVEFRLELARINAEHRLWLQEHGMRVLERRTHKRKARGTAPV